MKVASLVTLILALLAVLVGFFPCFGWVNWIGAPFCVLPVVVGMVGLITDKDAETGLAPNMGVHLAAVIGGALLGIAATVRCLLGGGVV